MIVPNDGLPLGLRLLYRFSGVFVDLCHAARFGDVPKCGLEQPGVVCLGGGVEVFDDGFLVVEVFAGVPFTDVHHCCSFLAPSRSRWAVSMSLSPLRQVREPRLYGLRDPGGAFQAQLGQVGVAGRVAADLQRGESGLFGEPCLGVAEAA